MTPFITLLAALAAITSPLVQAVPMPQAVAAAQQNCAAAQILAQGIAENIEDQKNEQKALAQVVQVLQQVPVDANAFAAAKANLLTFVNNGIAIRQANQAIAPLGNKAEGGLAIVADAQLQELNLSQGLVGDPAKDADAIKKLNDGFVGGLQQNQQNMMDAVTGCGQANVGAMVNGTQNAMGNKKNNNKANKMEKDDNKQQDMGKDAGEKKAGTGMDSGKKDAGKKDAGTGNADPVTADAATADAAAADAVAADAACNV